MITITIREFLKHDYSRDIYIDGLDDLGVGYEGPIGLKPEGEKQFALLLDFKIEVEEGEDALNAWVIIPLKYDLEKMGEKVIRFFEYIAGNCLEEDWERWFYFPKGFEFPENNKQEVSKMTETRKDELLAELIDHTAECCSDKEEALQVLKGSIGLTDEELKELGFNFLYEKESE